MENRKFNLGELQAKGVYQHYGTNYGYPFTNVEVLDTPITPKENLKLFMERKDFYWVPNFSVDCNIVFPEIVPDFKAVGFEGGFDSFGVEWIPVENNENLPAFVKPGNPKLKDIADWRNLEFPDVGSWDWENAKKEYDKVIDPNRITFGYVISAYFERLISLMDFENAAMALMEDPDEVMAFFDKLTDYNISLIEYQKKYLNIELVWVGDDWGAQRAPFFSRSVVNEIIVPYFKRFVDRAHELGIYVMHHCCGNSESFLPEMIEIGSDLWEPQLETNPNFFENVKRYGERILFSSYSIIDDISDLDEFRQVNRQKCKEHLSNKRISVQYAGWDDDWQEKNKITYELLRKVATDEI